jgi:hypothetical protein
LAVVGHFVNKDMITNNIIQRTIFVNIGDDIGSAFTIEKEGKQFLISARHVFETVDDNEEIEIKVFHNDSWKSLDCRATVHPNEEIDIIIFSYEGTLGVIRPIIYTTDGIDLGQDTYFLGFPYGKYSPDDHKINSSFPFPFVKKATFSAFKFTQENGGLLYLDGHTNPGFSGGPVVFVDRRTSELKICGVMRGYLTHEGKIDTEYLNEDGEFEKDYLLYDENSGIIVIQRIEDALKLLEKIAEPKKV